MESRKRARPDDYNNLFADTMKLTSTQQRIAYLLSQVELNDFDSLHTLTQTSSEDGEKIDYATQIGLLREKRDLITNIVHLSQIIEYVKPVDIEGFIFSQLQHWLDNPNINSANALGANETATVKYIPAEDDDEDEYECEYSEMFGAYVDLLDQLYEWAGDEPDIYHESVDESAAAVVADFIDNTKDAINSTDALLLIIHWLREMKLNECACDLAEAKLYLLPSVENMYKAIIHIPKEDRLDFILHLEADWNTRETGASLSLSDVTVLLNQIPQSDAYRLLQTHMPLLNTGYAIAGVIDKVTDANQRGNLLEQLKTRWQNQAVANAAQKREAIDLTNPRPTKRVTFAENHATVFPNQNQQAQQQQQEKQIVTRSGKSYGR